MTESIERLIRDVPDFPKPGILFKDITPLLQDPAGFRETIDILVNRYAGQNIEKVVGIDARGFIFAGAMAYQMGCGMGLVRKQGKLPWETRAQTYELEYGTNTVEIHTDTVTEGERIVIVDDLLATGGTMGAAVDLLQGAGAHIVEAAFIVELDFLKGRDKLSTEVFSLLHY
ncbi:MAG: adenine phosphoribosyltransferase [Myxococcales bacterium]|nr:adenine phosphoribosyltransferase [Myxococcales bacterium]|tara:strand:- start:1067 stop:1582 length:516 start_codon:yes stop_codon:yes gene_type:complete